MSKRRFFDPAVTIPDHWSADEALVVASFLKRISESIWAAHGHEMALRLYRSDDLAHGAPLDLSCQHTSGQDHDDIPF